MNEQFLHYLWKYSLYQKQKLTLNNGQQVEVIHPGEHNHNAGPDFFNAKIKVGDTLWAGNVEIHVNASDWYQHQHHKDEAYNNVILHVVAKNDRGVKRKNSEVIPTIEIDCPEKVYQQYLFLQNSKGWVPCETFLSKINEFTFLQWKEALLIERLKEKSKIIEQRFVQNKNNWEETFYQTLAANFGFKVNNVPFEQLAKSLPVLILAKHKDQLSLIEAMLFGQSGLLPDDSHEEYVQKLKQDYKHLANKFNLSPMSGHLWKMLRLRPGNFPTLRIAQFAALINQSTALMSKITEQENIKQLNKFFDIQASNYWNTHYVFGKETTKKAKKLGKMAFHNIVINSLVPFLFFYGRHKNKQALVEKSLDWLTAVSPEKNHIIESWKQRGVKVESAFDTQALIQLKNNYCKFKKCLNCRIGNQVVQHKF